MVTDSVSLCVETKLESIISVLARGNGVEELMWKECTIVVSKLLAPDMFKKFSMQEVRIVDETSVMITFSSQEVIETSHHSINFLLSVCLRDQITKLIEYPTILSCFILSESVPFDGGNVTGESSGSYSYSKYKVVKPARIV